MTRSKLHLLDAGIIIELYRQGIWEHVISHYEITIAETVAEESMFFKDAAGHRVSIDLSGVIEADQIRCVTTSPSQVSTFLNRFGQDYVERLDAGELESLVYLYSTSDQMGICSADSIVFKVLGVTDKSDLGISLEELLNECGMSRNLSWQYTKAFRDKYTHDGFQDRLQGFGPTS